MARRRRRTMTPAAKAASRANLEKARAARSRKSGASKVGIPLSQAGFSARDLAAHGPRSQVRKGVSGKTYPPISGKKTRQKPSGTARVRRTKSGIVMNEFGMALN